MQFVGIIHSVDLNNKIFGIKSKKRVIYFYLQNNLIKKFKKYLLKGCYTAFDYDENKVIEKNKVRAFQVNYFTKIVKKTVRRNILYYDLEVIQSGIRDLINSQENIMCLDLEMTMQDYFNNYQFISEIIQAGIIVVSKDGKILVEEDYYIKPTVCKMINARTFNFLGITKNDMKQAVHYKKFYQNFKDILNTYQPTILVWGKNDIKALKESYILNKCESLEEHTNFINLLNIQKNYFNLKNDLGLFKALSIYKNKDMKEQDHNALDDARVTLEVYEAFKEVINSDIKVEFPK